MRARTFIITLLLFLSVFFSSLLLISRLFLDSQIDLAMERGLNEHYLISNSMGKELSSQLGRGAREEDAIYYIFKYYSEHYARQKSYIKILKENRLLYSSFAEETYQGLSLEYPKNNRAAVVKKINDKQYIIVAGEFPQTDNEYQINYIYDITSTINIWKNMRNMLLGIGVLFSTIVAVLLHVILTIIFRPLGQIVDASKEIAIGNYEKRIHIGKSHELISLADSFNEMTERVELAIAELSDDARKKQQFIDNFSHEIRTPLTSVYGFAEYMQKSALSEEERINISSYIMEDSKHILSIADKLLDLAMLNNKSIAMSHCDTETMFGSSANILSNRLKKKEIHLIQEREVDSIYGDESLLQSLLINLTNNAIDASEIGGKITWQIIKEGDAVVLSVLDEGKGISSEEINKINEPFYRVDKSRSREAGNVGLGLAICQQIVECHGAKMLFESEPEKGTKVTIMFTT